MNGRPVLARLRTSGSRRAGVLLLALSFVFIASGEVLGRHHCAHHQAASASGHADGHASGHADRHADGHAGSAHHEAASPEAPVHGARGHGGEPLPCTCIGTCHGSAAAPLAPTARATVAGDVAFAVARVWWPSSSRAIRLLPHVLPFANGPPVLG